MRHEIVKLTQIERKESSILQRRSENVHCKHLAPNAMCRYSSMKGGKAKIFRKRKTKKSAVNTKNCEDDSPRLRDHHLSFVPIRTLSFSTAIEQIPSTSAK